MPCSGGSVSLQSNVLVEDLLFVHPFPSTRLYRPADLPELVSAVTQTTQGGRSIRAHGSNWSLSKAGVAQDMIDTSLLGQHISRPIPTPGQPLAVTRLRGSGSDFLQRSCALNRSTDGRYFVHVEAGIKIHQLLEDLGNCGLSLPTMGDGAGQSLMGAISTGTHGGDLRVPPLVEWIRTVHLVSASGREFWVTPAGSPFGVPSLVRSLPSWCPDARLVADNDGFDAVRLGVGRLGVVYSVVLEVVRQFTLIETNFEHRWSEVRPQLAISRILPNSETGIFHEPLQDLDKGFFRNEVLKRTYYPAGIQDPKFTFVQGPEKWPNVPAWFDTHPEVYQDPIAERHWTGLANDLRDGPEMPLHHVNIGLPLTNPERCWIRRRWKRSEPVNDFGVEPHQDDELSAAIKANLKNPPGVVAILREQMQVGPLLDGLGWATHNEKWERLQWYLYYEIAHIAQQHLASGATVFEAILLILYRMATDPVLDSRDKIASTVSDIIGRGAFGRVLRAGNASGEKYHNILDAHDYEMDGGQAGNSAEFHFDAAGVEYLNFTEEVIALARKHAPVFGYIGIRFTPAASALIAMQQYSLTASVEVATLRSRLDDVYAGFWAELHARRGDARAFHTGGRSSGIPCLN
jgi:FAD binding domain